MPRTSLFSQSSRSKECEQPIENPIWLLDLSFLTSLLINLSSPFSEMLYEQKPDLQ
ncbi:uncharacterized protein OGAPODRAFT_17313 [Ogataea polymorpha]|uniref:uncharacterized protein n=1 Tax=Ogataea polymorpha TaxID=460523 RepID=UPI0007F3CEFB|nr:uncharacterized protein OGAPODRAFT_17313 [Ogataea polymorpha]OBA13460.1 hypothetical protein OGAPODRAFT_17313 [Ogataea polymorpha]